jgi:hypothetical protein
VWLYFRFPVGLRMVEELLAARGIIVSHETVRQWGANRIMATADCSDSAEQFGARLWLQQSHKIIQNRLALLGEESVSVGHRRQPPGQTGEATHAHLHHRQ